VTEDTFKKIYADADLRGAIKKKARRMAATREAAEDAEAEAHIQSLRDAAYFTVASAVRQDKKYLRAWSKWVSALKDWGVGEN
jgi:hypothetical protein